MSEMFLSLNANYHFRSFSQETMQVLFQDKIFTCQDVFFMCPEKVVPAGVEEILRFIGRGKRAVFKQPRSPLPSRAICAACGYSERTEICDCQNPAIPSQRSVGQSVRSVLSVPSWRWLGAL